MKKTITLIGIIIVALIILFTSIYTLRENFSQSPLDQGFNLQNISCFTADTANNLYLIGEARKSIIKLDYSGILQYKIKATDKDLLYLYNELAVDDQGFLYVLRTDLDLQGIYVEAETIERYTPQGQLDQLLYEIDYEGEQRPLRTGNIKALTIKDNSLYFHHVEKDRVFLKSVNVETKEMQNKIIAYLAPDSYLAEINGADNGAVFYSSQKGEINRIQTSGESELLYPAMESGGIDEISSIAISLPAQTEVSKTFPTRLKVLSNQKLYFIDTFANEIKLLDLQQPGQVSSVFSQQELVKQGYDMPLTVLKDLVLLPDGTMIVALRNQIIWMDADGIVAKTMERGGYTRKDIAVHWLFWLQVLLAVAGLVYLLRLIYVDVMGRRVSIIVKQIVFFSPVIMISMVLLSMMVYNNFAIREEAEVFRKLETLTKIGQNRVEVERLENIKSPRDFMNEDYSALRELTIEAQMNFQAKGNYRMDEEGMYSAIYKLEEGKLYAIMDYDNSVNMYRPITIAGEFKQVLDTGKVIKDKAMDENGYWMFAMGPLYNQNGEIAGIYETGVDRSSFLKSRNQLFKKIAQGITATTFVIVLLFVLVTYYFLSSVRVLRKSVGEIASGHWEAAVSIDTGDEVADLGDRFNDMAEHIRSYIAEITELNEAYFRFVPQQFLNFLGKGSLRDLQLGDQVKQEMVVLSSKVRSFYKLTEGMSPEDNFNFINAYLKRVGPVVRENGGLIDKYSASGIVALFPNAVEEAVQTALEIISEIEEYNKQRVQTGYARLDIGIGIHRGELMLGIIGEERRMEGTVISDNVNITFSLERLSETFGATILITEEALMAIPSPERYQYRKLGCIKIEGKDEQLTIYDLFQGDLPRIRKAKLESRDIFEEAVALFQEGYFYDARSHFIEVIKNNRQDDIARIYFYLCEEYYKNGPPDDWNGTIVL